MNFSSFAVPYEISAQYAKRVAYFSMEFAVHQPLKIYSGGLGFLSGSHMRSAYELRQNLIGIGILWKYGYYDQAHFVREFKRFSGGLPKAHRGYFPEAMPTDFAPNMVSFVQDPPPS